ncbi:MAG: hypothetical protein M9894_18495 [Planctomycetes bacterium]|nr:hypothetical protein [Planctomycetota bacterium]
MATTTMIEIRCACGRRGHINSGLAGRSVRCTGCGGRVRVPAHTPSSEQVALGWAPPAPEPALELLPPVERPAARWEPRRGRLGDAAGDEGGERRPPRRGSALAEVRRRDLVYEGHLRAISLWNLLSGALGVVGALLMALVGVWAGAAGIGLGLAFVCCSVSLLVGALGWALWMYHGAGRALFLVLGALAMLGHLLELHEAPGVMKLFVLGPMGWTGAIVYVLASARAAHICTAEYRALVARTAPYAAVRWWCSPFFFVPMVLFALSATASLVMLGAALVMRF